ncbi:MAG: HEAT repeat domain-containing protein [Myxococcaceae bacterium]|nr:HEAT repeat domain-containing protein [Myxococcaceae bacterium]
MIIAVGLTLAACRDSAFKAAAKRDSVTDWKAFLTQHPQDDNVDAARARLAELEFDEAKRAHTLIGYKRFLEQYPDAAQARAAQALLETMRFNAAKEKGTAPALRQFVREHPDGSHRDEADALLKVLELKEVASLDEAATLSRIAAQNPDDPRAAEVSSRLDEVAWARATSPAGWLAYLTDFPAGAHRDEARTRLLSVQLEALLVSGLVNEAEALAKKSPLAKGVAALPARLAKAKALAALETSKDEQLKKSLPGFSRRALPDVIKSLQAPDAMDRWQAAEELGQFVTVQTIDPLLDQLRVARNPLIREAAFASLRQVLRALPRDVAEYEVATRLDALSATASDAVLFLTRAVLLDLSGQLEKAALEYQRAWDPQSPDPVVLSRWMAIRAERRQFFAGAVTARQLAVWAKEAAAASFTPTPPTAGSLARELCAAAVQARAAHDFIAAARREKTEFPDDLEAFEVRATEAVKLTQAKLRDAELMLLEQDARARTCGNADVTERVRAGEEERLKVLGGLRQKPPKDLPLLLELVRLRDPSPRVRDAAAP